MDNSAARPFADIELVAGPYEEHAEIVANVADYVMVKVSSAVPQSLNPLGFDKRGPYVWNLRKANATASLTPAAKVVQATSPTEP